MQAKVRVNLTTLLGSELRHEFPTNQPNNLETLITRGDDASGMHISPRVDSDPSAEEELVSK